MTGPDSSFFLLGVRGVGKSTWIRRTLADAPRVDLLDEALFQDLLREPGIFEGLVGDAPVGSWVIVDEIQRLPNLLNEVHRLIEARGLRFALLGSSARKLRRAGTTVTDICGFLLVLGIATAMLPLLVG